MMVYYANIYKTRMHAILKIAYFELLNICPPPIPSSPETWHVDNILLLLWYRYCYYYVYVRECTNFMGGQQLLIMANLLVPDSMHLLIISLYLGSNTCRGHDTDGKAFVHTNTGKYVLSCSASGFQFTVCMGPFLVYLQPINSLTNSEVFLLLSAKLCKRPDDILHIIILTIIYYKRGVQKQFQTSVSVSHFEYIAIYSVSTIKSVIL